MQLAWHENLLISPDWTHLGGNSPGLEGLPALTPTGTLTGGSPLKLDLVNAPPSTLVLAWLSFSSAPFNILGGTIHANPPGLQLLRTSDANGEWSQSLTWPVGIAPDTQFWLQFLVQDPSVPTGITLSNALTATTP